MFGVQFFRVFDSLPFLSNRIHGGEEAGTDGRIASERRLLLQENHAEFSFGRGHRSREARTAPAHNHHVGVKRLVRATRNARTARQSENGAGSARPRQNPSETAPDKGAAESAFAFVNLSNHAGPPKSFSNDSRTALRSIRSDESSALSFRLPSPVPRSSTPCARKSCTSFESDGSVSS